MDRHDVLRAMEDHFSTFPERESGNTVQRSTNALLATLAAQDRPAVIAALRELLGHRSRPDERNEQDARAEARLWTAVWAADALRLSELAPDLDRLIADVDAGRTLLPVYAETLRARVRALRGDTSAGE